MSKKFTLDQLTEGIRQRHMGSHGRRLTEKWTRTGLLRGLDGVHRENMAQLLENQAGQILREQNTLGGGGMSPSASSGDIRGFTNIAFPIVRRVFGGLVANELVSIQPMSLPSGLLFYLDYTYGTNIGGTATTGIGTDSKSIYKKGASIYNNPTGKGIQSGSLGAGGQYDLAGSGYSRVHSRSNITTVANACFVLGSSATQSRSTTAGSVASTGADGRFAQFDPQVTSKVDSESGTFRFLAVNLGALGSDFDPTAVKECALLLTGAAGFNASATDLAVPGETFQGGAAVYNIRRLNQLITSSSAGGAITSAPMATRSTSGAALLMVLSGTAIGSTDLSAFCVS